MSTRLHFAAECFLPAPFLALTIGALAVLVGCPGEIGEPDDDDTTLGEVEGDEAGECDDGVDNDQDGYADCEDSGCADAVMCADADGDGWSIQDGDCDDDDPSVHPGADETPCDEVDNDCDPATGDEPDADGDGFTACEECDDGDPDVNPDATEETCDGADNDCDSSTEDAPDGDGDGWSLCEDCDDEDPGVSPGADEQTCDGVDNDCDPATEDETDADGDGHSSCTDCDDGNADIYPGAYEECDGLDTDCDGSIPLGELDNDGDGYVSCGGPLGDPDCDDLDPNIYPGATELCDGADGDCDGQLPGDEADVDADGWMDCDGDCDDLDPLQYPGADEYCNGEDDDCDGTMDEDDALDVAVWFEDTDSDGYGDPAAIDVDCEQPQGFVDNGEDCDDGDATVNPGAEEVSCDGVDNDCDGEVDDSQSDDEDADGHTPCDGDCDDGDADSYPGAPEICDGVDNDCDGSVPADEGDGDGDGWWGCDGDCDDGDASTYPGAPELCDNADNDCDGTPDDGVSYDLDGDGLSACDGDCDDGDSDVHPGADEGWYDGVDSDCDGDEDPDPCFEPPPASVVSQLPACGGGQATGSFQTAVEWRRDTFDDYPDYDQPMAMPAVANVTDDNGDGTIDEDDVPDILFTTFTGPGFSGPGVLRALSGDGSGEHWAIHDVGVTHVYGIGNVAVGDLDGDGLPEVVTTDQNGRAVCVSHDGQHLWTSNGVGGLHGATPAIADLDQDGTAEVILGSRIISHLGAVTGEGGYGIGSNHPLDMDVSSVAADVTGDGMLEVVVGDAIYDASGYVIWANNGLDGYPAVADFDGDVGGEIVVVSEATVRLHDDTGGLLWGPNPLSSAQGGGPPVVADFDGDGFPEIGVAGDSTYDMFDTDGTLMWTRTTQDSSSQRTGSSAFDFDGDGQDEVAYADEQTLFVYEGTTGDVLVEHTEHASGTVLEYPVIADVDADGHAEMVIVSNDYYLSGWRGITVIGEQDDEWPPARTLWNQHAYHVTNVDDDGGIPVAEPANWPLYNTFRHGGGASQPGQPAADAFLEEVAVCLDACADEVTWILRPANQGVVDLPSGVTVSLYGEDVYGDVTLLDVMITAESMPAGQTAASLEISLLAVDLVDVVTVFAVVDDPGDGTSEHDECDEANNQLELAWPVCP